MWALSLLVFLKMLDLNLKSMFVIMSCFIDDGYSLENIAILNAKGATFGRNLWDISKNEGLRRLNSSVLEDKGVL